MIPFQPNKYLIGAVALVAAFAIGRYTASVAGETKTEVSKSDTTEKQTEATKTHTVEVTEKKPDGSVLTTVTTDINSDIKTAAKVDTTTKSKDVVVPKGSKINIATLVAVDLTQMAKGPAYGLSVSKELIGPVTVGIMGLTNGTVGVSFGLDF